MRQKIGYTYSPQVINDVTQQPRTRSILQSLQPSQPSHPSQSGGGMWKTAKSKAVDIASSEALKQASKIIFDALPSDKQVQLQKMTKPILRRRQDIKDIAEAGSKLVKEIRRDVKGSGLSVAGGGMRELPGDALKKKLLRKMVREEHMRSLGDRVKTSPIKAGFNGGSLSRTKTLPYSPNYTLNPKPLVGGFLTPTILSIIGTAAAKAAIASIINKKISGSGVRDTIVKIAKEAKISYRDLSEEDKEKLKTEFIKLAKNRDKAGVIAFAKSISPIVLKTTKKKLNVRKVLKKAGLYGSGMLEGAGEKKFKNEFVKHMLKQMGVLKKYRMKVRK